MSPIVLHQTALHLAQHIMEYTTEMLRFLILGLLYFCSLYTIVCVRVCCGESFNIPFIYAGILSRIFFRS